MPRRTGGLDRPPAAYNQRHKLPTLTALATGTKRRCGSSIVELGAVASSPGGSWWLDFRIYTNRRWHSSRLTVLFRLKARTSHSTTLHLRECYPRSTPCCGVGATRQAVCFVVPRTRFFALRVSLRFSAPEFRCGTAGRPRRSARDLPAGQSSTGASYICYKFFSRQARMPSAGSETPNRRAVAAIIQARTLQRSRLSQDLLVVRTGAGVIPPLFTFMCRLSASGC